MSEQAQLSNDDPRLVAWDAYKNTEDFANSRKWAQVVQHQVQHPHLDGSLWALFLAGYEAGSQNGTELAQFRQTVADALDALRADVDTRCLELQCNWKRFDDDKLPEDAYNEATVDCIEKAQKLIDATIAALGLPAPQQEKPNA